MTESSKDHAASYDSYEDSEIESDYFASVSSVHSSSIKKQLKLMTQNPNSLLTLTAAGFSNIVSFIYPTIMQQTLEPHGFTTTECDLNGMLYIMGGLVGGVIVSMIMKSSLNYKAMSMALVIVTIMTLFMIFMGLKIRVGHSGISLLICFCGFSSIGLYSVIYEFGVSVTPGIGESFSTLFINI